MFECNKRKKCTISLCDHFSPHEHNITCDIISCAVVDDNVKCIDLKKERKEKLKKLCKL